MTTQPLTLEQFEDVCLSLSTEAMSVKGSLKPLRRKLPEFFEQFNAFVNSRFFDDDDEMDLALLSQSHYSALAKKGDYMALRRRMVLVPKGLNVTYLDHLETLSKSQDLVDKLMPETLVPFERFLGTLLTHPDTLKSQRESGTLEDVVQHDLESMQEMISKDFTRDGNERRAYGDVIERQRDWPKIVQNFNSVTERLVQIPRKQVIEMVETITEHLNVIVERIEEDPEAYAASGVTISSLAKMSYAAASEVEYYSIHAFMVEQLQTSIEDAAKLVKGD